MTADPLELLLFRSRQTRERALKLVEDLSDEQLAWRPGPTAHCIGWTLWHLARCADVFQKDLATDGSGRELWTTERLAERWGFPAGALGANTAGTGVPDEAAAGVPLPPNAELVGYARRAFAALDEAVGRIDRARFAREHRSLFVPEPTPIGNSLLASLTHDNRHLGEMEYLKGLLGLRGSVTT